MGDRPIDFADDSDRDPNLIFVQQQLP